MKVIYKAGYSSQRDPDTYGYYMTLELALKAITDKYKWSDEHPVFTCKQTGEKYFSVYRDGENCDNYILEIEVEEK